MQDIDQPRQQIYYPFLDMVRVVACFLVILLHVSAIQFTSLSGTWQVALLYDALSRMAVPLFFMLSGFLLLDTSLESLSRFYIKRYIRILIPFFTVCVFYYFTPGYAQYSPVTYFAYIITHFVDYHLWYVYTLCGLYLTLPFFIIMLKDKQHANKLAWLYVVIWIIAFVVAPAVTGHGFAPSEIRALQARLPDGACTYIISDIAASVFTSFNLLFFYGFMGYFIVAWIIKKNMLIFPKPFYWLNLVIFIGVTVLLIIITAIRSQTLGKADETYFNNLSPFVFLQAISFFIFCSQFKLQVRLLRELSDKSYWIYLIHILLLRLLIAFWPLPTDAVNCVCIPFFALLVFTVAYFASIPLRAIEMQLLRIFRLA